jgi:hypothetical protein
MCCSAIHGSRRLTFSSANYPNLIAFEFAIPRMGKRVDNIVLFGGVVFVLEFKVSADQVTASAIDQATDYSLDLKNFHAGSHNLPIVPIVIATTAVSGDSQIVSSADGVAQAVPSNGVALGTLIKKVARDRRTDIDIDPAIWVTSGYKPTPTIIKAAQALYRGHRVDEITRCLVPDFDGASSSHDSTSQVHRNEMAER